MPLIDFGSRLINTDAIAVIEPHFNYPGKTLVHLNLQNHEGKAFTRMLDMPYEQAVERWEDAEWDDDEDEEEL